MLKAGLIMKKLWIDKGRFIDPIRLKAICKELNINYKNLLHYLLARKYLIRIFRGIFYVKSVEEIKFEKIDMNHLELVANGLKIKGIKNWYFGLYTALKLNNVTHEYFATDFVVNDKIFRAKETTIANRKFKFIKIKPPLIFGVEEKGNLRYSDLEKTILDFIYLWRYRGVPEEKILIDISDLVKTASKKRLLRYAEKFPKNVRKTLEAVK